MTSILGYDTTSNGYAPAVQRHHGKVDTPTRPRPTVPLRPDAKPLMAVDGTDGWLDVDTRKISRSSIVNSSERPTGRASHR